MRERAEPCGTACAAIHRTDEAWQRGIVAFNRPVQDAPRTGRATLRIDLPVTDAGLPGMNGRQLAVMPMIEGEARPELALAARLQAGNGRIQPCANSAP